MAITKSLFGSIVVLDLKPDGTLRAANVERHYVLTDGGTELARPIERDVLTTETVASVLPQQADLMLRVQELEQANAALAMERDAAISQRDALQAEKDAATARAARSVSPLQARKALKATGMLTTVQAMVAAAPEDDDVRLAWDWALTWERDSQFIDSLGAALGLTSQQIDDLFALAATM